MIEIEKPRIERVEIGENNRYGKFVVSRWSGALARPWAIRCAGCSSTHCLAWL